MMWIIIIILECRSEILRLVIKVYIIAELLVDSVDVGGSGNPVLVSNILPVDWITRIRSWFSVFRVLSRSGAMEVGSSG